MDFNSSVKTHWLPELKPYKFEVADEIKGALTFYNGLFSIYTSYDDLFAKEFEFMLGCKHGTNFRCINNLELVKLLKLPISSYEKLTQAQTIEKFVSYFDPVFRAYGTRLFDAEYFNKLWDTSDLKLILKPWF